MIGMVFVVVCLFVFRDAGGSRNFLPLLSAVQLQHNLSYVQNIPGSMHVSYLKSNDEKK